MTRGTQALAQVFAQRGIAIFSPQYPNPPELKTNHRQFFNPNFMYNTYYLSLSSFTTIQASSLHVYCPDKFVSWHFLLLIMRWHSHMIYLRLDNIEAIFHSRTFVIHYYEPNLLINQFSPCKKKDDDNHPFAAA